MAVTLSERLVEAEAAYHQLSIGKAVVEVRDSSGESVRYTNANSARLRAYIAELKGLIADEASGFARRGPLRPLFT